MSATPDRSIVIANAGSGKTWTLANRVLAWCMREVRASRTPQPAQILAVTFTRKAAGEILARILSHAAQGAQSEKARASFASIVGDATAAEYLAVLGALCRDLHRMQVGTIDGFFSRIASALADEVGLGVGWTIGDDDALAQVRATVAAKILAGDSAEALLDLLKDGAPSASVTDEIERLLGGGTGFGGGGVSVLAHYRASVSTSPTEEKRLASLDAAWRWSERLLKAHALPSETLESLAKRLRVEPLPPTKGGNPHRGWITANEKLCDAAASGDALACVENNYLAKMARADSYYSLTPSDALHAIAAAIGAHVRGAVLKKFATRVSGALLVLPQAEAMLDAEQAERGVYGFDDIGRNVARAAVRAGSRVGNFEALCEALGCEIRDLAIDEAQDTSVEQFVTLRPMIQAILSSGNASDAGRFLLVGDPKQSIYGWRGGTPGLIAKVEEDFKANLDEGKPLTKSFRSAPILMDFVNQVFGNLEADVCGIAEPKDLDDVTSVTEFFRNENLLINLSVSAFKRAPRQWEFAKHEASNPDLGGRIEVYGVTGKPEPKVEPPDDGDTSEEAAAALPTIPHIDPLKCAAVVAARIHAEHPQRTIGVLVRTNKEANTIVAQLRRDGVAVSDEGSSTLLDSPAVDALVAVLELIDDPSSRLAHFLASRGPIAKVTALAPLESHATAEDACAVAAAYANKMRVEIAHRGLATVVADLVDALRAQGLSARDESRVARCVAVAEPFNDAPCARLHEFIDALINDKAESSSADKIRVMTIHRSKGLEFDEVVLVSLGKPLGKKPTGWGVLACDPCTPPQLVSALGNEFERSWVPELKLFERDERRRRLLDDFSTLYVAITRARKGLHLMMECVPKSSGPTAAKLIIAALDRIDTKSGCLQDAAALGPVLAAATPSLDTPCWTAYDGDIFAAVKSPEAASSALAPSSSTIETLIEIIPRQRQRASAPSTHEARSLWSSSPFGNSDIALRGVFVHECFREVKSMDEFLEPTRFDGLLERAAQRTAVEKGAPIDAKDTADVRGLLTRLAQRSTEKGSCAHALMLAPNDRVHTELPFVRLLPSGGMTSGRIDRLVLHCDGSGAVKGATIVDYKTGAVGRSAESLAETISNYSEQMHAYCAAVEDMWKLDPASVRATLLFVDRDEVVRVEPRPVVA